MKKKACLAMIAVGLFGCAGADGDSCTVTDNGDGSATIACEDGTMATVTSGMDGMDGMDGMSCTVAEGASNTSTITCEDGTTATVEGGGGCTVVDNGDGTSTLSCEDGTSATITDGSACSVMDNGDGTSTITCDDGTTATVSDGSSCSVMDNGDGTSTITCDDGSSATVVSGTSCTITDTAGLITIDCDGDTFTSAELQSESFAFPAVGDTRTTVVGTRFWNVGDRLVAARTHGFSAVLGGTVEFDLVGNVTCDTQDVDVMVNGEVVRSLALATGETSVRAHFDAHAAGDAADFTVTLRTTRTVNSGCGAYGYVDGGSLTLYGIN